MFRYILTGAMFSLIILAYFGCDKIDPPEMLVKPTTLNFGEVTNSLTVKILNMGDEKLEWRIDTNYYIDPWVTYSNFSGTNESNLVISVNRDTLVHGSYSSELHITSNGGDAKVDIIMIVFK